MKTVKEVLQLTADFVGKQGLLPARHHAEEIVSAALEMKRIDLYINFERPLTESELERCRTFLKRRLQHEPIQYISGEVDFYHCQLRVTPDVLIPRPETEQLVDRIAAALMQHEREGKRLLDLCCGSGCIGIALKKRFPELSVTLADISSSALAIAAENSKRNEVDVTFFEGDLLDPVKDLKFDYVVCNPPYVTAQELAELDPEVRDFEPHLALVGGETGLEFYQRLALGLPQVLLPAAHVWLEIGAAQGPAIQQLFINQEWQQAEVIPDWSGRDRFLCLIKKNSPL